jgi:hypothetical protein
MLSTKVNTPLKWLCSAVTLWNALLGWNSWVLVEMGMGVCLTVLLVEVLPQNTVEVTTVYILWFCLTTPWQWLLCTSCGSASQHRGSDYCVQLVVLPHNTVAVTTVYILWFWITTPWQWLLCTTCGSASKHRGSDYCVYLVVLPQNTVEVTTVYILCFSSMSLPLRFVVTPLSPVSCLAHEAADLADCVSYCSKIFLQISLYWSYFFLQEWDFVALN